MRGEWKTWETIWVTPLLCPMIFLHVFHPLPTSPPICVGTHKKWFKKILSATITVIRCTDIKSTVKSGIFTVFPPVFQIDLFTQVLFSLIVKRLNWLLFKKDEVVMFSELKEEWTPDHHYHCWQGIGTTPLHSVQQLTNRWKQLQRWSQTEKGQETRICCTAKSSSSRSFKILGSSAV